MNGRYTGKTVAVTGAGEGMGRAMALAFAREGAAVMACDVNAAGLEATAGQLGSASGSIATMIVDVRDEAAVAAFAARAAEPAGNLDVMICNAGVKGNWAPIAEQPREQLDQHVLLVVNRNDDGEFWRGHKFAVQSAGEALVARYRASAKTAARLLQTKLTWSALSAA